MFGQNEIVGKKHFKDQKPGTLTVTSRFFTLQGEGPFRGEPAVFLRLSKCNLACSFCDTYFDSGTEMTFADILEQLDDEVVKFFSKRSMHVPDWATGRYRRTLLVITGGEPSLQPNLKDFLAEANKFYPRTQIESNGIAAVDLDHMTTYVVSPKCLEKNGKPVHYLTPNPKTLERADCLKFVMCAPGDDNSPYSEIPAWAHDWAEETGKHVFVSPMNIYQREPQKAKELRAAKEGKELSIEERSTVDEVISFWEPGLLDMEKNRRNHEYAAEYAMKHGFILNLQIHLLASLP